MESTNTNNNNEMLTATKVCQHLDISFRTLDNWYKYAKSDIEKPADMPVLPQYTQERARAIRLWNPNDLPALEAFKNWIPKGRNGVMGRINQKYWKPEFRKED